ncbi:N-6 DNA methylase [Proteus terrae]|uniref:N-6 DNA methylase n=1 Tax=Proteus terrae TaxID=1574161 RepID=UPI000D68699E|nr:N-6 DNA methylase [Proteus terrae]
MSKKLLLTCPVRGILKATAKSKDGLKPTEEYYRVQAIKFLIKKGFPAENIKIEPIIKKFGNGGRNSFRSDFAVLDVPIASISNDIDEILEHTILLCEVKRDNNGVDYVKSTQVEPMLDFAKLDKCVGLYWDNVEQRIFWKKNEAGKFIIHDGPLSFLPTFGHSIEAKPITFNDTVPSDNLIDVFDRIEDILHQSSFDPEKRYEIILQLLLAKIFDEHAFEGRPNEALLIQDFQALGTPLATISKIFNKLLSKAVSYYEKHLPNPIPNNLPVTPETLREILKILAPIRITHSKRDIVQKFYMKFAKDLYRWDLAQFFTPTTVTDFIVDVINPQFGDHVCDPACGSADFLVAAFHVGRQFNHGYADCVWGVDNSANAVQIAVLNMVLNGDGKTNIIKDDSLENFDKRLNTFDIMLCNPPFGTKITEKRSRVLKKYELGYKWKIDNHGKWKKTESLLDVQETGILFAELCVKQAKPGGRIGLIVPNGYLGNRSEKYRVFREWLLKNTKLAGVCSFPRFTFKTSGADVSASIIFLEKRITPLNDFIHDEYYFFVEMIENVGWDAGNKKAAPIYKRNSSDGSYIINEKGDFIIDSDFNEVLNRIRCSVSSDYFDWINPTTAQPKDIDDTLGAWSVNISSIINDLDLTMDPKRYCKKSQYLREKLQEKKHFLLGELVEFIPEKVNSSGSKVNLSSGKIYNYIEIADISFGEFISNKLYGWELPSRAKHFVENGDIYFGSIWGSVSKWCYIGNGYPDFVVTNGCHRCRIKTGMEEYLVDLIAYMNTEGWSVQMRAFARGSDGLAEISIDDAKKIVIPLIESESVRNEVQQFVDNLKKGKTNLRSIIQDNIAEGNWDIDEPTKRPSHIVLV